MNQLSASLSAADAHVVVMGNAFVGLVHPCKIYNILAVGAPVLYIGPQPSHVTEILADLGPRYPWAGVEHGEAEALTRHNQDLSLRAMGSHRQLPEEITATFAKDMLLPKLMAGIEKLDGNGHLQF